MKAEIILVNGRIYTVDPTQSWVSAVAILGSRIAAMGSTEDMQILAGHKTEFIDLEGKVVLPGFCDAHIHMYDWSLARRQVPVSSCASLAEMLALIGRWSETTPQGRWLSGRGWNENNWDRPQLPSRSELDRVTGERPAIFWRTDMHAAVANSAALRVAGIDQATDDPPGGVIGRDERGQPNGMLWELAINKVSEVMPKPEPAEMEAALIEAMAELHRLGVTAVHDQRMKDQDEGPFMLATYQRLAETGRLKLRVNCNVAAHDLDHLVALGLRSGLGSDYLRLGHVKLFTDGSMGSQTAWMLAPYERAHDARPDYVGVNVTPPAQMAAEIRRAAMQGFPASVHAIGDRANREVLDIFEELAQSRLTLPAPHRIEHVQILDPADGARLVALDLTASVQPLHALDDMDMAEAVLGERASRTYNFGRLAAADTRLALGSDAPVADPNPFLGIHAAVIRQRPDRLERGAWYGAERLSLAEAIRGYTLGAAEAGGWQQTIGSITPGKRADLIVLDRDLFRLVESGQPGREIADTQVELTMFDGQIVQQRDR